MRSIPASTGLSGFSTLLPILPSPSAREKVEAAGGSLSLLREPKERKPKHRPRSAAPAGEAEPEEEQETEGKAD